MKKIFTLLVSLGTLSTVFAQGYNHYPQQADNRNTDHSRSYDQANYGNRNNTVVYGRDVSQQNNRGYNDRQRQQDIDRINHDYDNRITGYRNDRSINAYERNRRIQEAENQRNSNLKSFGGGVLLGGILGVILGTHL